MNNRLLYLLFFVAVAFTSCVPLKDLTYLQDKGDSPEETVNKVPHTPYKLQVNDLLSIEVKAIDPKLVEIFNTEGNSQVTASDQALYLKGYNVDDHGNIRMPILGEINVQGFTVDEVRVKIEELLLRDHFNKEAGIFVNVRLSGFKYTVNGEVAAPGSKIVYKDSYNLLEAIANAGDITMVGDRKDVKVIRQYPQGSQTFSIDLTNKNAPQSPGFHLQPNDYIYVKPLKQKSWGTGKTGVESLSTIISLLALVTTTLVLLKQY